MGSLGSSCDAAGDDSCIDLADVVLDIPTTALDSAYTYAVPSTAEFADLGVGCAVKVPFGRRSAVGFVVSVHRGNAFKGMKRIYEMLSRPFFGEFAVECARFLSKRYVAPLSTCIRLFAPPGSIPKMVRGEDGSWLVDDPKIGAIDDRWVVAGEAMDKFVPRANASRQIAILDALKFGDVRVSELNAMGGNPSAALAALQRVGAIRIETRRRVRGGMGKAPDCEGVSYAAVELPYDLTEGQRCALAKISKAQADRSGRVVLIDGVTGSGKTEVYLQAIASALDEGKTAIMLVPEISLTPQTVARFHSRFGDTVAVLHSKMSYGERFDQLDQIRQGGARVVVGARSALFAPLDNLGLIVIDEEHESTYKQESAPRYVARDVAAWMMKRLGGTLILGSATPSIESLYRANKLDGWDVVEMHERANGKPMPPVEVVDMTRSSSARKTASRALKGSAKVSSEVFSPRLASEIVSQLEAGHKVVLLLNQRGFAKCLLCDECGFVARCTSCSTTLTYHSRSNALMCHHCGYTVASPAVCPECSSPYLVKRGVGTQRVEGELRALIDGAPELAGADVPIIRMDADTTSRKGAHARLLEEFASSSRAVLLGTQMIAKGLDFDDVTLVGVVNADTQLHLPDFRSSERTFDLIEQVAGRAGRGSLPGLVMVQTHEPNDVAIKAAATYDRDLLLRSELPKRRILKYPPYVRMANALFWGKEEGAVEGAAKAFWQLARSAVDAAGLGEWDVLPPVPCVFERIRGDYRWHMVVKCPMGKDISAFLRDVQARSAKVKGVNVAIDIDPFDLL